MEARTPYKDGKFRFEFENSATPGSLLNCVVSSSGKSIILSSLGPAFSRS